MGSLYRPSETRLEPLHPLGAPCALQQPPRGGKMFDLLFLAAILAAFALFAGLTHGCERL